MEYGKYFGVKIFRSRPSTANPYGKSLWMDSLKIPLKGLGPMIDTEHAPQLGSWAIFGRFSTYSALQKGGMVKSGLSDLKKCFFKNPPNHHMMMICGWKHCFGPRGAPDNIWDHCEAFWGDFWKIEISCSRSLFGVLLSCFSYHFRGKMVENGVWGVLWSENFQIKAFKRKSLW